MIPNLPPPVTQAWAAPSVASVTTAATGSELLQAARDPGHSAIVDTVAGGIGGSVAFVGASATGANIFVHESGHAMAAELLFQNANTQISVTPLSGGETSFNSRTLSDLGQRYGRDGSLGVVAGAGPLVDVAISMVSFAAGFAIRKKHPLVGGTMMGYATMSMIGSVAYAGSAMGAGTVALAQAGNDFASLAVHAGISPVVAMAVLAALLPAEYCLLKAAEKVIGAARSGG